MHILPWLITKRAEEQRAKYGPKREPSALPGHSYDTGITIAPFKALDWTKEKASLCSEGGRGEKMIKSTAKLSHHVQITQFLHVLVLL